MYLSEATEKNNYSKLIRQLSTNVFALAVTGLFIFQLIFAQQAKAEITAVNASTSSNQVSLTSSANSQINWNVSQFSPASAQVNVGSERGEFISASGNLLGLSSVPLQATRLVQQGANTLFVLPESLVIPRSIIRLVQQQGENHFQYRRTFADSFGGNALSAVATFNISGGSVASELIISRVEMKFDNDKTRTIISKNDQIKAKAFINYQGTGLLDYSWEIAKPPSTSGTPMFFPIVSRKQFLMAGGMVTLQSPELSSIQPGDYLVRLNIGQQGALDKIALHYVVNNNTTIEGTQSALTIQEIQVQKPKLDIPLTSKTEFVWQPVSDAAAYQIEIYARPIKEKLTRNEVEEEPLTGVVVRSDKNKLFIGDLPKSHLKRGHTYYWRIVAFSSKGDLVAKSKLKAIRY